MTSTLARLSYFSGVRVTKSILHFNDRISPFRGFDALFARSFGASLSCAFSASGTKIDTQNIVSLIKTPTVRLIYIDEETGQSAWKIIDRKSALKAAQQRSLDLILVTANADPPVCKLDKYAEVVKEQKKKEKERKVTQKKNKPLKELYIGVGIDSNDLRTKLRKLQQLLAAGHPVKVGVIAKRHTLRDRPFAVDEMTVEVVSLIEEMQDLKVTVQMPEERTQLPAESEIDPETGLVPPIIRPLRKEFTVFPKKT